MFVIIIVAMNTKQIFDKYGQSPKTAQEKGLNYGSVYSHYSGYRTVTAEAALVYERVLGIPRWELRPDLWTQEMCNVLQPQ